MILNLWDLHDILIILPEPSLPIQEDEVVIMITEEVVHHVSLVEIIKIILVEDNQEMVLMQMALLVKEHLVVIEVFLLVDFLDHKALKDLQDFKEHESPLVRERMIQISLLILKA